MRAVDVDADVWSDANLRDPFPLCAELRALAPVVRLTRHDAYAITRYADIRDVLQDWESFTSAKGVGMSPLTNARAGRGVISSDPPVHDSRRRVLNSQLLPAALKPHEAFIEAPRSSNSRTWRSKLASWRSSPISRCHSACRSCATSSDCPRRAATDFCRGLGRASTDGVRLGPRSEAAAFGYQCLVKYSDTVSVPEHLEPGRWGAGIYDAVDRGDMEPDAIHGVVFAYLQAGMDTTVNAIGLSAVPVRATPRSVGPGAPRTRAHPVGDQRGASLLLSAPALHTRRQRTTSRSAASASRPAAASSS